MAQEQVTEKTSSIEDVIAPYIEKLLTGIEKGANFAAEQLPDVIQQYLVYESVYNGIIVLIALALVFMGRHILRPFFGSKVHDPEVKEERMSDKYFVYLGRNYFIQREDDHYDVTPQFGYYWGIKIPLIITGVVMFFNHVFDFVKVCVFPKTIPT